MNILDAAHLTLVESLRMQQLAARFDILFAMAEACGFICLPMPEALKHKEHSTCKPQQSPRR